MTSRPLVRLTRLAGAVVLIAVLVDSGSGLVHAQGKLDAAYVVSLGGVPIGKGSWSIDVQEDQFTATASGATSQTKGKRGRMPLYLHRHGPSFTYASTISS